MPVITCQERRIACGDDDVLHSLERAGIEIPSSCRTGHCQSCLAQLKQGELTARAQRGLNERQRALNYFLTCQYRPRDDIEIELLDTHSRRHATLVEKHVLDSRVLRVRLEAEVDWRAGQYLTLWRNTKRGRVYSIASLPAEGCIELHMRRRGGQISGWVEHQLQVGEECAISLPRGDCYYSPAMPGQPLVLVGIGTGLSPVYGVLKQALADGHHGEITLYACAGEPGQLYLLRELRALDDDAGRLNIIPVVRRQAAQLDGALQADITQLLAHNHPSLRGHLVYLCGTPALVAHLQYQSFMQGAHHSDIFCDPFEFAQ
ncbi:2Fe-2S iron-sulfur cluster binding domain-containing protein [Mangrovimicrobium sediminis]|uniref:2Fe-2S iron-sulfur cluster binding domain-containing protein n=1 Tax=Mangrovimicrobium sediminis TaxID=2562682 RepID=A0A4Z0M6R5_9GAMM|nr:2Fe-2S iron-sulfur cluster binding domain-containing protein [Haliea sp. SAOS-164]TGD75077.1 2Fe-2S iron-sulfur cluster binding domain-containing protein [Haliea sp. SAOS-164]